MEVKTMTDTNKGSDQRDQSMQEEDIDEDMS